MKPDDKIRLQHMLDASQEAILFLKTLNSLLRFRKIEDLFVLHMFLQNAKSKKRKSRRGEVCGSLPKGR